jgi:hypothetical protein
MRNIYSGIEIIILLLAAVLISCGASGWKKGSSIRTDPRTAAESRFDALSDVRDRDIITSDVAEARESELAGERLPVMKQAAPQKQADQCFSAQVYATKSSAEANQYKASLDSVFEGEIMIDYQAPYYRICVGRCSGFESAEELLRKVNAMGFSKAWLVKIKK